MKQHYFLHATFFYYIKLHKSLSFYLLLLIYFFLPQKTQALNEKSISDIKWSKNLKIKAISYDNMEILKQDKNSMYFFNSLPNSMPIAGMPTVYETLAKYDSKLDSIAYLPLILKTEDINRIRLGVVLIDSAIHIVSYFNNKNQDAVYIFDETINMKTFEFNNDIHKILEIKYDRNQIKNSNDIYITLRKEEYIGEKLFSIKYIYSTKRGFVNGYEVIDNKLVSLAKHEYITDEYTATTNYVFDKDYNLYTIERRYEKGVFLNYAKSKLNITCYPNSSSTVVKRDLILENQFITEQTLSVNDKNQIICGGLYACNGLTSAIGIFTIIYSQKLQEIGALHKIDFGYEFLSMGLQEKEAKTLKKDLDKCKDSNYDFSYSFHNIHLRKDGGFDFVIEKWMKVSKSNGVNPSGQSMGSKLLYRYSDIYVLAFNQDGSSRWVQKIYRNEEFDESLFYTHFLGDCFIDYGVTDEINIIHNKFNIDNEDVYGGGSLKKGITVLTTIDSKGNQIELILTKNAEISKNLCPKFTYRCDNGTYRLTKMNYLSVTSIFKGFSPSIYNFNFGTITLK